VLHWRLRFSLSALALLLPLLLVMGIVSPHGCLSVGAGFGYQGSPWPPAIDLVLTLGAVWCPSPRRAHRHKRRADDKYRRPRPL
jgi:hypothetical protein